MASQGIATLTFHSNGATIEYDSTDIVTIQRALERHAEEFEKVEESSAHPNEKALFAEQASRTRRIYDGLYRILGY